ncbi:hypothetical protein NQ317_004070 [Molorchus minor]|uniref:Uncharacterized protein n=1 Tax=Molorchus minor TaxID=1323400 RepID=A0ABQ9JM47_9CUCU|nr:hypothetical protein NQ317_004070 [Molorchus minor]
METLIIYYDNGLPARLTNDHYIHRLLTTSSTNPKVSYTTYYTEPVRKYIGKSIKRCIPPRGEVKILNS